MTASEKGAAADVHEAPETTPGWRSRLKNKLTGWRSRLKNKLTEWRSRLKSELTGWRSRLKNKLTPKPEWRAVAAVIAVPILLLVVFGSRELVHRWGAILPTIAEATFLIEYVILVGVSVAGAGWVGLAVLDVGLAVLWLVFAMDAFAKPVSLARPREMIRFWNRQWGHLQFGLTIAVLAVAWGRQLAPLPVLANGWFVLYFFVVIISIGILIVWRVVNRAIHDGRYFTWYAIGVLEVAFVAGLYLLTHNDAFPFKLAVSIIVSGRFLAPLSWNFSVVQKKEPEWRRNASIFVHTVGGVVLFLSTPPHTFRSAAATFALTAPLIVLDLFLRGTTLAETLKRRRPGFMPEVDDESEPWARRPIFYVFTAIGWWIIALSVPSQKDAVMGVCVVVTIGAYLRLIRWAIGWRQTESRELDTGKRRDWYVTVSVVAIVGLLALVSPAARAVAIAARDHQQRSSQMTTTCGWTSCAPIDPVPVSLFLIADTQFHYLSGKRTPGHLSVVDQAIPVAVRPIEQDLLSGATLAHFAHLYGELRSKPERAGMKWAHLGDYGDLACRGEMNRFWNYLPLFGRNHLAALVPGNHDSTFVGNFGWHPAWEEACKPEGVSTPGPADSRLCFDGRDGPLRKVDSDRCLLKLNRDLTLANPSETSVALIEHPLSDMIRINKTGLAWVSLLGHVGEREVVGAFLDTSDFTGLTLGIAGAQGGLSTNQIRWVADQLELHSHAGIVIFMHHPVDELSAISESHLDGLASELGDRLLAIVSAHTHQASYRSHRLGGRLVPEFVIGSTTDAPQEAALLEVGLTQTGQLAVRVRSLPALQHPQARCEVTGLASSQIRYETCDELINHRLRESPGCKEIFAWPFQRPSSPEMLKEQQATRAHALLACLCRDGRCQAPDKKTVLDDDGRLYRLVDSLSFDSPPGSQRYQELVCLSWAASVLQQHKAKYVDECPPPDRVATFKDTDHMTFGSAARLAFARENILRDPVNDCRDEPVVPEPLGTEIEYALDESSPRHGKPAYAAVHSSPQ